MARREARILTTIWGDPSWRSLTGGAQWLYLFLISQPDIAHDGVISLRERRWAQNAQEVTPGEITGYLKELEGAGYVLADQDTEEVLVRSFMRHDQVFLQPNLMAAAVSHLGGVESHRVRRAIYSECARIIRENSDRARRANGDRPLTEKQKTPIRMMIEILRLSGDAELAIEAPRIQHVDLPEDLTANPSRPSHKARPSHVDLRSTVTQSRPAVSNPSEGEEDQTSSVTRPSVGPTNDPLLPAETPDLGHDLVGKLGRDSHETRPSTSRETRSEWVNVDTEPYDVADPRSPGEVNPSAKAYEKPLVRVSPLSPYPLPLTPLPTNGHDPRSASQGDLFDDLEATDGEPTSELTDPLLDEIPFSPTPEQERAGAQTQFERFWDVYPIKVKKGYARQCWDKAIRHASPEKIIRAARRYAEDPNRDPRYTRHPSTWLNSESWDDDPLPPRFRTDGPPAAQRGLDIAAQRRAARRDQPFRPEITGGDHG
jgi:hypothetical protein